MNGKVMLGPRVFTRNAGFLGNLGQSMAKIVPKPHKYFKIAKPFGFSKPPTRLKDTKSESILTWENLNLPKKLWNFYFDGITRRTRVEAIQKDLAYGGMYDFHVYTKTKGRLFESPISYFRKDRSLFFPNFRVKSLTGKRMDLMDVLDKAKLSILRVYSTDAGYEMTNDYFKIKDSEDNYMTNSGLEVFKQEYPGAQIVEVILSENASKHFIHTFITPGKVSQQRPEEQHDKYLIARRDTVLSRDDREKLLLTNAYSGYIYIVDSSYKIRWAGSGWPTETEVIGLWKAVRSLLKEAAMKLNKNN
ncbi:Mitochondrial ATPase complex subunit atp10 [Pichia californica]|uniref:Mitochondrial ATPase complex subunit atp10 n=1 Tax=Pichia californica TaxID=460514 RepID=A0A9P6WLG4_9ASCO|nr:Mitochondrial ATPase complex subunit atp10 [[Candida] californica]KAG0688297.1 Mitochondrial ATPase complex subunit atp10 [[Candida] californica]